MVKQIYIYLDLMFHIFVQKYSCALVHTNSREKVEQNLLSRELITAKTSSGEVVKFMPMSSATKRFETLKRGTSVSSVHDLISSKTRNKPYFVSKLH